jgi:hypothetical protein
MLSRNNMPKRKANKHYAVAVGRKPGIYDNWDDCQLQVCWTRFLPALILVFEYLTFRRFRPR